MSRFEFDSVTRQPFLQEPQPDKAPHADAAPTVSDLDTKADVISASEPGDHPHERHRQELGNRGPDEEPGFGQGG
jgi:hypothetical protein